MSKYEWICDVCYEQHTATIPDDFTGDDLKRARESVQHIKTVPSSQTIASGMVYDLAMQAERERKQHDRELILRGVKAGIIAMKTMRGHRARKSRGREGAK